MLHSGIRLHH